ncbi:MAG: hypothetical protein JWN48_3903 [Myxococcaceae bacterium]|nr:hypothetical protein [Myxococcaceae bacterium]
MPLKSLVRSAALGLLVLGSACGDDSKGSEDRTDASLPGTGGKGDSGTSVIRSDAAVGGDLDASLDMDAALRDSSLPSSEDGSVSDAASEEGRDSALGAEGSLDAAQSTVPDAATGSSTPDAATADAATTADAAPRTTGDAGNCSINDPIYGCGTAIGTEWIRFDNGYEADRTNKLIWSPPQNPNNPATLTAYCYALSLANQGHIFDIPQMEQVRFLAAGCSATEAGGACKVETLEELPSGKGTCDCSGGTGPHPSGGFCRPELSSCVTLRTRTYCGPNVECETYRHWYYDVATGSIVVVPDDSPLATSAQGRCVTSYLPVP